jgi:diguanylate cyclase (GGDEF)-like protein
MTGDDRDESGLRAIHYGAQEYLIKGQVEGDALTRIIRHATERNRLVMELEALREREYFLATHDPLTNLPNRQLFRDRAELALAQARRHDQKVALCFIDLDGFKPVNDIYGHAVGDELLRRVANELAHEVRQTDTVARIGGDEFAILLMPAGGRSEIENLAQRFAQRISDIQRVLDHDVHIAASVGVALYPEHSHTVDELLQHADMAMYCAKGARDKSVCTYDEKIAEAPASHARLAVELGKALNSDQLLPFYQPWWDIDEDRMAGVEVLARWQTPNGELIYPDDFLPATDNSSHLLELGKRMLTQAAQQWVRWREQNIVPPRVEVNLSLRELREQSYLEALLEASERAGLPASQLQIQISGRDLLRNRDTVTGNRIGYLRAQGVRIGLGNVDINTPAALLAPWQIDSIRLSRSWLPHDAAKGLNGQGRVLERMQEVARGKQCDLIVNGVETDSHYRTLREAGCRYLQGFWRAPASDGTALARLLRQAR